MDPFDLSVMQILAQLYGYVNSKKSLISLELSIGSGYAMHIFWCSVGFSCSKSEGRSITSLEADKGICILCRKSVHVVTELHARGVRGPKSIIILHI
jgi:hypothetical protein